MRTSVPDRSDCLVQVPADELASNFIAADETGSDRMNATSEVLYDVSERIATITLNRPERMNTISPGLTDGLAERMVDAAADPGVRAIILTGAGRAFCAGADMQSLQKSSAGGPRQAPPPTDPKFLKSLNPTGLGPDLG
jgi:hypothetical protein